MKNSYRDLHSRITHKILWKCTTTEDGGPISSHLWYIIALQYFMRKQFALLACKMCTLWHVWWKEGQLTKYNQFTNIHYQNMFTHFLSCLHYAVLLWQILRKKRLFMQKHITPPPKSFFSWWEISPVEAMQTLDIYTSY